MLDPGYYKATVVDGKVVEVGKKKTPAMQLDIEVTAECEAEGTLVNQLANIITRQVTWYLSKGAREFSLKRLEKIGYNGDPDWPEFSKPTTVFECTHEEWEGKDRERWDLPGGNKPKPASEGTKAELVAAWKEAGHEVKPGAPKKSDSQVDDEIPF